MQRCGSYGPFCGHGAGHDGSTASTRCGQTAWLGPPQRCGTAMACTLQQSPGPAAPTHNASQDLYCPLPATRRPARLCLQALCPPPPAPMPPVVVGCASNSGTSVAVGDISIALPSRKLLPIQFVNHYDIPWTCKGAHPTSQTGVAAQGPDHKSGLYAAKRAQFWPNLAGPKVDQNGRSITNGRACSNSHALLLTGRVCPAPQFRDIPAHRPQKGSKMAPKRWVLARSSPNQGLLA